MTDYNHQQRSGRRKEPKARNKVPGILGIKGDPERLVAHREFEYLRNPTVERWRKLKEAQAYAKRMRKRK